jgi:menaquinone-dependent protoporphyrinogen oxidase
MSAKEERKKALVVYGTRYGATKTTSQEIAQVLKEHNFDVTVADAKKEKIKDISEFELVVVGSGMALGDWVNEAEDFLKRHRKSLETKKLALFISSLKPIEEKQGKTDLVEKIQKNGLENKKLKYQLQPISQAMFGGVVDYNKLGFLLRKGMEVGYKAAFQKHGIKEVEPGVFDLRDWNEIRSWARELAKKTQE